MTPHGACHSLSGSHKRETKRRPDQGILALTCFAAFICVTAFFQCIPDLFAYEREALEQGQLWRLVTAHWVHADWLHLSMNALALGLITWLFPVFSPRRLLLCSLNLAVLVSAQLWWLSPELSRYVGFSAVLHGLLVIGLCLERGYPPLIRILVGTALLAKLSLELTGDAFQSNWVSIPVYALSHSYGVVAGCLWVAIEALNRRCSFLSHRTP